MPNNDDDDDDRHIVYRSFTHGWLVFSVDSWGHNFCENQLHCKLSNGTTVNDLEWPANPYFKVAVMFEIKYLKIMVLDRAVVTIEHL